MKLILRHIIITSLFFSTCIGLYATSTSSTFYIAVCNRTLTTLACASGGVPNIEIPPGQSIMVIDNPVNIMLGSQILCDITPDEGMQTVNGSLFIPRHRKAGTTKTNYSF
jgi:hypothetical protein